MHPAFFVFLGYFSTSPHRCQHIFSLVLYIFPVKCHTNPVHRYKKEVLTMAKNNQNQNQNQNKNQNQNQNQHQNQNQNKQAKECN